MLSRSEHFNVFTRKFTPEEITALNFRKNLVRTNHKSIADKKWIFNPALDTEESFSQKISWATVEPWANEALKPTNVSKLID